MTTWTNASKVIPADAEYYLNIGSSFSLLIDGTYKLLISPASIGGWSNTTKHSAGWSNTARNSTTWSNPSKN